uniref:Cation/H+ exchanger transmembrane domain-containing protein n=1 Tax=Leersia perrieri TaxID=77586 RepID=A0A0D9VW46_9ORYZ
MAWPKRLDGPGGARVLSSTAFARLSAAPTLLASTPLLLAPLPRRRPTHQEDDAMGVGAAEAESMSATLGTGPRGGGYIVAIGTTTTVGGGERVFPPMRRRGDTSTAKQQQQKRKKASSYSWSPSPAASARPRADGGMRIVVPLQGVVQGRGGLFLGSLIPCVRDDDSLYYAGLRRCADNPYHLAHNPDGIIQLGLANNYGLGTGGVILMVSSLKHSRKQFFHSFMTITLFGAVGTLTSFTVISLALGAIFSATDSVCTLRVLNQDETPLLYSLVFGGVVNDATSAVLYSMQSRTLILQISAVLNSCNLLAISFFCLPRAPFLEWLHSTDREVSIMMLMACLSYMLAEVLDLSGILTIFFCGIVMSHYTRHNVTESSRVTTKYLYGLCRVIIWWSGLMRGVVSIALAYNKRPTDGRKDKPLLAWLPLAGWPLPLLLARLPLAGWPLPLYMSTRLPSAAECDP